MLKSAISISKKNAMSDKAFIATAILLKNYLTNIGYKRITNKKIF